MYWLNNLFDLLSNNILVGGVLAGIIAIIIGWVGNWLLPKISDRFYNKFLPDIDVIPKGGIRIRGDGYRTVTIILKVENNTASPLSFSTPELFVRKSSRVHFIAPEWIRTELEIPIPKTASDISKTFTIQNVKLESNAKESEFQSINIRVPEHNFILDVIYFHLPINEKPFNIDWRFEPHLRTPITKWLKKGNWMIGKLEIKPVGSKQITKIVYIPAEIPIGPIPLDATKVATTNVTDSK